MDNRTMMVRATNWARIIEECNNSGKTVAEFCKEHNITSAAEPSKKKKGGCTLTAEKGISVNENNKLTIYAQSTGECMGRIFAFGDLGAAGIGGGFGQSSGEITVNGGYVKAVGGLGADGIGGGFGGKKGTVIINGGQVDAVDGGNPQDSKVNKITLNSNKEILLLGNTVTLSAEVLPETAENRSIIWTSLDSEIATVSNGAVTAKGAGSTVIVAETVDGGYKDFCLIRVAGITPVLNTTAAVDYDNGIITGIAPMLDNLDSFVETSEENLTLTYSTDTIGTGTIVNVVRNGEVVDAYTTVLFGDVNNDGIYDGTDAIIVNCIANGLLSREQVGEAVYMAADCNHDDVIDSADVAILEYAGVLLAGVDQTKSEGELLETSSAYVEYLNLIDQTVETETTEVTEEELVDPGYTFNFFDMIFYFIKEIITVIKTVITYFK